MNWISIKVIAQKHKENSKSIQKALERGTLKGKKDKNGLWLVKKEDAEEYYKKPPSNDWLSVGYCVFHYGLSRKTILEQIDCGNLIGRKFSRTMYVHYLRLKNNIVELQCIDKFSKIREGLKIKVINKGGIHMRPIAVIGGIIMKYKDVDLYMKYKNFCGKLSVEGSAHTLLTLNIKKKDELFFKADAKDKKEAKKMLKELKVAASKGFCME